MLPIDELIRKADTTVSNLTAIIPQLWASELEPNLRKREVLQQALVKNTDLVGVPGDRVFLPTLPDIAAADDLTEDTDMVPIALSNASSVPMIPSERGKSVGITRKALDRMKYDGISQLIDRLAYSMSLKIEGSIAQLWNASVPGGGGSLTNLYPIVTAPNTRFTSANLTAAGVFDSKMIRDGVALLKSSDVMPFDDGLWLCFMHPKQIRDFLMDADVRNDLRYGQPETLFRGEIGVYHNTRIIESTHVKVVGEGSGGTVNAYKSLLVGPRWAAIAYKRLPELVVDPTVYDFGRRRKVGIVADFDIELVHNERGLVLSTAATL